jgi:hypothetical protein
MATLDKIALALQGFGAGVQGRGSEFLQQLDERRKDALLQDAIQVQNSLESGDVSRARNLLVNRVESINKLGGDPSDTMGVLQKLASGDTAGALNDVRSVTEYGYQSGRLQRAPESESRSQIVGNQLVTIDPKTKKATASPIEGLDMAKMAGSGGYQFGASEMLKDSEGNLFTMTQRRDPVSGEVISVAVSVDGDPSKRPSGKVSMVGGYGLTAGEKIGQVGAEKAVETAASEGAKYISSAKESGLSARGLMQNTQRLLDLNKLISTGATAPARKVFANLFNIEDEGTANLAEFNQRSGQMILGMIRQLGANPTEGERAYLSSITPSIEQGNAPNEAMLTNLLEIQKRQFERGKWLARNPKATIDDLYRYEEENDFSVQENSQPAQQQDDDALVNKYLVP